MGRNNKVGLDYFPFDIDFFEDEKIEAIFVEFGIKGEITAIKLLCAIYRNGYFIVWNDRLKIKLLKNLPGISETLLEQIVQRLVKWDFFDENLFNSASVLTSSGIQKRYFTIIKRRKQNEEYPYLLINVDNKPIYVYRNDKNVLRNDIKESKEENNKIILPPIIPQGDDESNENKIAKLEEELKGKDKELQAMTKKLVEKQAPTKSSQANKVYDISFVEESFKDVFKSWLDYKRERKETYKSKKSLEVLYKKLLQLSNGDCETARLIVEQSMANNWAGLFELKNGWSRKEAIGSTASDSRKEFVCNKTEKSASLEFVGAAQEDYSSRF